MQETTLHNHTSPPQNVPGGLQASLARRFSRLDSLREPIVYEFTHDPALLHQYHTLLERMYAKTYNARGFKANLDPYDDLSYILIARRGRLCLGGCRITIREADEFWDLPLESEHFKLREVLSDIPLTSRRHCEFSRFAVMDDNREEDIFRNMCSLLFQKVIELQVHYAFVKSTYPLARSWRFLANNLGVKTTRICNDVDVPGPSFIPDEKWYITASDLSSLYTTDYHTATSANSKLEHLEAATHSYL